MLSTMWRRKQAFFMGNLLRPIPFFLLMIALCSYAAGEDKRVVCYYTNWSVYRPGTAKFSPQNINPYLCTHLIYAFGGLDKDNGLRPYDKYQDIEQGGYAKFTGLKTYNKNLKTMLAIGGWNEGSARFSPLVADEERRREFVKNVVKFLRQNHFDGLDLDWEYPAFRDGGKPRDRDNYAQLVQELREEFEKESSKTGRTRLLLTMAVPAGIEYIDKGYDIPKLNRYLDFMNILSYDYHSAFEPAVNHHSPLYSLQEDDEYNFDAELSIDYTIKHYLKSGADRDKLVLGIPTYGRSYTLFNPDSTALGSPADGPGEQGEATREKGYLAYYEICQSLNSEKDWKIEQPKLGAMGPYAYKDKQWVGYDDAFIVKEKAKYVNDKNLGGIMFWSIDNDDFRGKCHDRPYPLIEAGKEMLFGTSGKKSSSKNNIASSSQTETKTARPLRRPGQKSSKPKTASLRTTTAATTTRQTTTGNPLTTPEPPTTPDPGSDFVCKDEGFFPHPRDCKKYFWCLDSGPSNLGIVAHQFTCPSGLFFNKAADSCDFARNVLCKDKRDKAATSTAKPTTSSSTTQQTTTASSRLKFTAATAKSTGNRYTTTTTTTTEPPPEEDDEDEVEDDYHAEEDPQTIKQLITLIKKLGGVAELEKQLENNGGSDVTNSPISKTLYNKVLTPGKFQSPYRNGPSGPQNEGLPPPAPGQDDSPYSRREKPQYVTIRRERPSTDQPVSEEGNSRGGNEREEADDEQEDGVEEEAERERPIKPLYSTIQRRRPSTSTEASSESTSPSTAVTKTRYSSIQRSRPSTVASDSVDTTTSRYVTLQRHRPQQLDTEEEVAEDERVSPLPFVRSRPPQDDVIEPLDDQQPTTTTQKPAKKVSDEATELRPVYEHTSELSATTTSTTTTTSPSAADDDDQLTITSTTTATTTDNSSPRTNTETTTTEGPVASNDSDSSSPGNIASNDSDSSSPGEIPTISTEQTTAVPYQTSTITSVVTVIVEGATERQRVALGRLEEVLAEHNVTSSREQTKLKDSSAEINKIAPESSKEIAPTSKANRTGGQLRNIPRRRLNVGKVGQDSTTEPYRPSSRRFRPTSTEPSVSSERPSQTRFIPSRTRNRTSVAQGDDNAVTGRTRSFIRRPQQQDVINNSSEGDDVRPRTRSFVRKPAPQDDINKSSEREDVSPHSRDFRRKPDESTNNSEVPRRNPTRTRSRFSSRNNSTSESTPINDSSIEDTGSNEASKLNELTSTRPRSRFAIARNRGATSTTSTTTINPPTRHVFGRGRSRSTTVKPEIVTSEELTNSSQSVENTSRQRLTPYYVPIQRTSNNQYLIHHEATRNDSSEILIQMENTNVLTKSKNKTSTKESSAENTSGEILDSSSESVIVNTTDSNVLVGDESGEKVEDSIGSASGNSQEVSKSSQEVTDTPVETTTVVVDTTVTTTTEVPLADTSGSNMTNNLEETKSNSTSKFKKQRGSAKFSLTDDSEEDASKSTEVEDNTSKEVNSGRGRKLVSADTSGKEELVSRSKFNVENFDRHKSSAKSRDISQSDHDDKVFLESVDDSGLRKRKKVVRLLPRNRNGTNETTSINDSNGKRIVTVVRPRNSVGRNSVGKENEFEVKTEQPSSTTVRSNSNFLRTSTRNRDGVQTRTLDDDFLKVKTDDESTTVRNSVPRSRTKFNRNEVITNLDVNEEEFLRVNPDESFTSTVRNNVQRTPTRTTNRNNFRSRNSNSVGDVVSNLNTEEPVRNSFQRTSSRNRNVETSNSVGRDNEFSTVTDESTVRSSFQRTQSRNRNNAEGRGSNIRGRYEKKEGTTLTPETSSRGRIRFRVEDDGSSLVNDNSFDDVYDENGFVVKKKKKKPKVSEETGVRYEEDVGHNYRKVVVRNRVIHRKNTDKDSVRGRSRVNNEDLETGQSGRVSKKVDDDVRFENSLSSAGAKKSGVTRNRGSVRAKESLKDEVEGVDYDEEEGGEEGGHRERATNIENEIAVETESEKENTRIRIVPVRRVVSRNRSTSTEEPPTTAVSDNFTSRRYSNKFRQKEAATTTRQDPTSSQQSDSDDFAITTVRPRKFTFPKRLARPSTTLETPIAEQLQKTTERPFDSQEDNTSGSGLPDLADVGVVAIQALATVPPSNFQPVTYSTPSSLFPRRTSTVQTLIHHTIPVTSLGTGTSPQAVTAVSSSTVRSSPSLIQAVTQTHRAVPRPFSKKRPTTLAPPPKPAYITKGRTKHVDEIADYEVDYYAEPVDVPLSGKVRIHNDGYIECLDVGNFPHPFSCRKFISCAKMETEHLLGWEYTCPRGLSFDPIGGICNWSAGLGCKE
ncbi:serine-rich adhesin for platelets [Nilaparvata lugens]|uniref:serine-rich adhesin for platelets n=1 Tax=Nilaparvata lugens TaxID=108931 RepID=UPI00193D3A43|nr:serine-rich adhesin for platelets [Nilaparvata lugens]